MLEDPQEKVNEHRGRSPIYSHRDSGCKAHATPNHQAKPKYYNNPHPLAPDTRQHILQGKTHTHACRNTLRSKTNPEGSSTATPPSQGSGWEVLW